MPGPPNGIERRNPSDTIEVKLSDIREQLQRGSVRMDGIETQLEGLKETNEVIRSHIEATCEFARAASVFLVPFVWVATRIRQLLLTLAAIAVAVLGIDSAATRFGWW